MCVPDTRHEVRKQCYEITHSVNVINFLDAVAVRKREKGGSWGKIG